MGGGGGGGRNQLVSFFPHPRQFPVSAPSSQGICSNDKTFLLINSNLFYDLPPFFHIYS